MLLACLAGLFSERSGIFDIGLEGKMLAAAMASGAVAFLTGSVWLGLLAGIGASLIFALIHGIASITFRGNQLISGVALNFLASGLTVLIAQALFGRAAAPRRWRAPRGSTRSPCPSPRPCSDVPILGPLYHEVISGHSLLVYVALADGAADAGGS